MKVLVVGNHNPRVLADLHQALTNAQIELGSTLIVDADWLGTITKSWARENGCSWAESPTNYDKCMSRAETHRNSQVMATGIDRVIWIRGGSPKTLGHLQAIARARNVPLEIM